MVESNFIKDESNTPESFFYDFWSWIEKQTNSLSKEDFFQHPSFRDFYSSKDSPSENRLRLEKEILELKKRELWRKYTTLMSMVPITVLFAFELQAVFTDSVLLSLISGGLSHTIMPFLVVSLICTLYLIHNNKKIKKKEQELENVKSGKSIEEENNTPVDKDYTLDYIDVITTTLCILLSITSESLSQELIGSVGFLFSNLVGFGISYDLYCSESNKINKQINGQPSEKNSDIQAAKFMLAGSSILLAKRIILMALSPALSATMVGSTFVPALGLIGMICFMVGYAITINSYRNQLKDITVNKAAIGVSCNTSSALTKPHNNYGNDVMI